ncbi:MAG: type II toxin-antitoxin system HicA family toxin [Phycisphaerales bacterium]
MSAGSRAGVVVSIRRGTRSRDRAVTPVVKARELIRVLKLVGFVHTRTNGSHWRFEHEDGR